LRELTPGGWYQGQVALVSGEIGDDLLHYYWQSEQTPSALAIGVLVGTDGRVAASGGLLVQALPDLSERERERVSENFRQLSQISWRLSAGETLEALLAEVLGPSLQLYAPEPIGWRCWCSRARMQEILLSLPAGDYQDLVEDGGAELTCHFCRQAYRFDRQDLLALRSNLGP
jgi:molecular chaperone Hsp33